ncbi:MAG TPA: hypothetical protein VM070_06405, partial [Candidatus Saccharimonadales bacterium]|nr:hypothetical protein [Candidatus Saccharimonadales bacterium]
MTIEKGALAQRRSPVPADRYLGAVRLAQARLPRRRRLPLVAAVLCWSVLLGGSAVIAARAGGGLATLAGDVGSYAADLIPAAREVDIPPSDAAGVVATAPLLDPLSDFVATPALLLQGRIPSFAISGSQRVQVRVNDGAAIAAPVDANGHFAAPISLKDGPNSVVVALLSGGETLATTTRTIVLDRLPPPLGIAKPKSGDTIDGSPVVVEGKAEPYAVVTVNDKMVFVGADGSYSEAFTAPSGPLSIAVVARDRAGNETRSVATVTVRERVAAGTLTLFVALDRPTVKPGATV